MKVWGSFFPSDIPSSFYTTHFLPQGLRSILVVTTVAVAYAGAWQYLCPHSQRGAPTRQSFLFTLMALHNFNILFH